MSSIYTENKSLLQCLISLLDGQTIQIKYLSANTIKSSLGA